MVDSGEEWQSGGVLSVDPIVTYTLPSGQSRIGIAGTFPDLFRNRRALHLIGFAAAAETFPLAEFARDIANLETDLVDNRFVFVANDEYQALLLSQHGLPTIVGNNDMLVDERVFTPMNAPGEMFDAVYNARFLKLKRHELAVGIDRLMLIYDAQPDPRGEAGERIRRLLPHAYFANQNKSGDYHWLLPSAIPALLARCHVGLCLSAAEGTPRVMMEYLLCGLMVVSTASIGGRSRYLMPPFARIVPDDPDAVASAVRDMVAKPVPREAIRDHIGRIISFERHNFLLSVNRIAKAHFGIDRLFASIEPIMEHATHWRPASAIIAPLRSTS